MGFYEELSKYYDIVFPFGKPQLKFMLGRIKENGKVLDLASGTGNYSIALAKEGYNVAAVDLDEEMVNHVEAKNRAEGTNVKPYVMDMKKIDSLGENTYDGIVCIGNSLVHLNSTDEIKEVLNKMYNILSDDGVVILQIVNYDRILKYDVKELPLIDRPESGVKFVRNYDIEDGKVLFKTKLIINGERTYDNCIKLYPLQSQELVTYLKEAGFTDIKLYGGFDEKEYTIDSFPLVVEARK